MTQETEGTRLVALLAHDAGLCVLPPKEDGSKSPSRPWKQYQHQRPNRQEIEEWYRLPRSGLGFVCGEVSGGLEVLEFDDNDVYQQFKRVASGCGLGALVERVEAGYSESSPSGGIHWLYTTESVLGNMKLARRPEHSEQKEHAKDEIKTLIETRGEGGYIIVAPSNGKVHPSGGAYRLIRGGVNSIATVTPEERESLFELARSFDQMAKPEVEAKPATSGKTNRSGDDFNTRGDWREILERQGWVLDYENDGTGYWRRPGKEQGISATTNFKGSDLLFVFSTSTPFKAERGYSKFSAYGVLEHQGDFKEAAKALAKLGYGRTEDSTVPLQEWPPMEPLPAPASPVPNLPNELVPGPLRPWLVDVAERACIPLEFVACPAIVGIGAVVGRSVGIRPVRLDDYLVVPNLWGGA